MRTKLEITVDVEIDFDYVASMRGCFDSPVINDIKIDYIDVERRYRKDLLDMVHERLAQIVEERKP